MILGFFFSVYIVVIYFSPLVYSVPSFFSVSFLLHQLSFINIIYVGPHMEKK